MISLKAGVAVRGMRTEILFAVMVAAEAYAQRGKDLMITSCADGRHSQASLHYAGAAVDLRTRDLAEAEKGQIVASLRAALGGDYDVVIEQDHLHIEYQPKGPLNGQA